MRVVCSQPALSRSGGRPPPAPQNSFGCGFFDWRRSADRPQLVFRMALGAGRFTRLRGPPGPAACGHTFVFSGAAAGSSLMCVPTSRRQSDDGFLSGRRFGRPRSAGCRSAGAWRMHTALANNLGTFRPAAADERRLFSVRLSKIKGPGANIPLPGGFVGICFRWLGGIEQTAAKPLGLFGGSSRGG